MAHLVPDRPIRAVAFDLDGLIYNTEHVFNRTAVQMVANRNLPMPPDLLKSMMGRRAEESFLVMKQMLNLADSIESLQQEAWASFFDMLDLHLRPMPGLFELLSHLETCQLPKAVATSSPRWYMERMLGRHELAARFSFALTAEDVTIGKPNPEIYLKAAAGLGVDPAEMLVLEDSEAGTRAAAAAGAFVISVPHEHSSHHDFSVAKRVAKQLDDILIMELLSPLARSTISAS